MRFSPVTDSKGNQLVNDGGEPVTTVESHGRLTNSGLGGLRCSQGLVCMGT
ncbi:hypothetical protein M1D88_03525 [Arthrobacter sp. R1-13]